MASVILPGMILAASHWTAMATVEGRLRQQRRHADMNEVRVAPTVPAPQGSLSIVPQGHGSTSTEVGRQVHRNLVALQRAPPSPKDKKILNVTNFSDDTRYYARNASCQFSFSQPTR